MYPGSTSFDQLLSLIAAAHAEVLQENDSLRAACGVSLGRSSGLRNDGFFSSEAQQIVGGARRRNSRGRDAANVGYHPIIIEAPKRVSRKGSVDLSKLMPTLNNNWYGGVSNCDDDECLSDCSAESGDQWGTVAMENGMKGRPSESGFGAVGLHVDWNPRRSSLTTSGINTVPSTKPVCQCFEVLRSCRKLCGYLCRYLFSCGCCRSRPKKRKRWSRSDMTLENMIINPERSSFLEYWDMIIMVCLTWVAILAPVQLSLIEPTFDVLFVVNCMVDCAFFWDMVLQFFTMFPKQTKFGYTWEHNLHNIARRYLRTWFVIDFISILPFDFVGMVSKSDSMQKMKVVKVIRLMRLLKLARVLKASRLFRRFEVRMSITYGTFALMKFFIILLLVTHWLANLWALTLVLVDEHEGVPRWIDAFDELETHVEVKTRDSPLKTYINCLYFTSYTITSVGYGDIGPTNIIETIVCTIMVVISGVSWAVVLGEVCGIISNMNPDEQTFRNTMDELNYMMQDRVVPPTMRRRLRSFFLSKKTAQRRERHASIIGAMSPGLQGEVVMEVNRVWITRVSFLNKILQEAESSASGTYFYAFVVQISLSMQIQIYAQSEVFGVRQAMYILSRGLVSRRCRKQLGSTNQISWGMEALYSAGSVWGLDFLLSDLRLQEPPESLALTYVETMVIKRDTFLLLVERNKSDCPGLKAQVRRFCCWLAFQRALMKEAHRRIRKQRRFASKPEDYSYDLVWDPDSPDCSSKEAPPYPLEVEPDSEGVAALHRLAECKVTPPKPFTSPTDDSRIV